MNLLRRVLIAAAIGTPLLVAGCAATAPAVDPAVARVLAPTGTLRVGVYPGSPTSLVVNPKTGERAGVAMELGQALGNRLGVPVQVVEAPTARVVAAHVMADVAPVPPVVNVSLIVSPLRRTLPVFVTRKV